MNHPLPKVSVVTPSYNQGKFLEQTIQSVLSQDYPNIEYIVMDGGSTDASPQIIQKYNHRLTYWVSAKDRGQASAIVKGFEKATGEIFAYLNSDDYWMPNTVSTAVNYLLNHPQVDMVCGNRIVVNESGKIRYYRPWWNFGFKSPFIYFLITQESAFWRKSIYEKIGGINPDFKFAMDYDLFARISKKGHIAHCRDLWAYFRKHADSKTQKEFYTLGRIEMQKVQKEQYGKIVPKWQQWVVFNVYRILYVLKSIFVRPKIKG